MKINNSETLHRKTETLEKNTQLLFYRYGE